MALRPNDAAGKMQVTDPYVIDAVETIAKRAELVGDGTPVGDYVRAVLKEKLDVWRNEAQFREHTCHRGRNGFHEITANCTRRVREPV